MTVKELYNLLQHFIDNDFAHLRNKVDRTLWIIISGLLTIICGLIFLVLK